MNQAIDNNRRHALVRRLSNESLTCARQMTAQFKTVALFVCTLYLLPLLFLFIVVVVCLQKGLSFGFFMRDPAATAEIHPFVGLASNLGVILWTASATICLFSWAILRRKSNESRTSKFLLCSGLLTMLLMLDDFFLLHEDIFRRYFGLSEKIVLSVYLVLLIVGIARFKQCILKTDYVISLSALGFFGLSMFVDLFQPYFESAIGDWRILFEDGFKLFGIVGWFGYFLRCSLIETTRYTELSG